MGLFVARRHIYHYGLTVGTIPSPSSILSLRPAISSCNSQSTSLKVNIPASYFSFITFSDIHHHKNKTMSRTTTTEAASASWRPKYLLETEDGQYVPLIFSHPRADPSKDLVFKLDSKWKAIGHALKMELKTPIPTAFSGRRSITSDHTVRPFPPQEILAPAYMALVQDHIGSGLPRREPFALVRRCTHSLYFHVLIAQLGCSSCRHAKPVPRTPICISMQSHGL